MLRSIAAVCLICCPLPSTALAAVPDLHATRLHGGWVTVIGTSDGGREIELAKNPGWLVHGVALRESDVDRARQAVQQQGLTPRVKISLLPQSGRLPYAEHMVNVLVASAADLQSSGLSKDEVLRVLAPQGRGITYVESGGRWDTWTKPMPPQFGTFPAWLHGADGNMVGDDTAVDVPNSMRFISGPRLQDANGANPWRVAGGVAVCEWNNTVDTKSPIYYLEGRDAFNGTLLWQQSKDVPRGQLRAEKSKPLVIAGSRVIISDPSNEGRLVALDLFTGEEQIVYERSAGGDLLQFCVHGGKIYQADLQRLLCIDVTTGELDWEIEYPKTDGLARPVIAADLDLLIALEAKKTVRGHDKTPRLQYLGGRYPSVFTTGLAAFRLKDGSFAWRVPVNEKLKDWSKYEPQSSFKQKNSPRVMHDFHTLTYHDGRVFALFANDANRGDPSVVWAVDARAGKDLWAEACGPPEDRQRQMFNLFALDDGTLFTIGHSWARLDAETGASLAKGSLGGNARCDTHCATVSLITAGFGNYFKLDPNDPALVKWNRSDITRGQCGGRLTPAYGMTYHMGSGCGCYTMVRGNMALQTLPPVEPLVEEPRRITGPAVSAPLAGKPAVSDWPVYLGTSDRRGWSVSDGPGSLKLLWERAVAQPIERGVEGPTADALNNGLYNGPTTAPVIASGIIVLADRDNHRVIGLDAATGDERWSYQADGRIITPPTLSQGRAVFGDRCGYVHCLDLRSGRLAWRFLAAPVERYVMAYGQIESTWPLHGCLPVVDGTVVASAGYHGETDGGVWAWGLDLATGEVKWSKALQRTPRQWQVAERYERAKTDIPVLTVRDVEGGFSVKNGSGFYQSIPLNIELPSSVGNVAQVAKVHLEASTGALATTPGSRFSYRERYPFLDMESEYRGGPHGSGGWRTQFGGLQIGDPRGGHMRIVMEEKTAYIARPHYDEQQRSFGMQVIRYDADNMPEGGRLKRISPHQSKQFAFFTGFYKMDSFIVAGDRGYAAAEGLTQRLHWNKSRLRRAYKGESADGSLLVFDRESGQELERLTIERAVINNGLAVAEGRLYAACEDGVLRCYSQGTEPPR